MYRQLSTDQIQSMSMKDLKAQRKTLTALKADLKKNKDAALVWPEDKENEYVAVCENLDAVNKRITELSSTNGQGGSSDQGTNEFVVLIVVPAGGKHVNLDEDTVTVNKERISLSIPEWNVFKKHYKSLGYTIYGVENDPTGEAESYIKK